MTKFVNATLPQLEYGNDLGIIGKGNVLVVHPLLTFVFITLSGAKLMTKLNKNSSKDEIANVNFLRRYGTYVLQNTKKENLLRLTN